MSQALTNTDNAGLTDYNFTPTTDVWQDELNQLQSRLHATWHDIDFRGWVVPVSENIGAFEDIDIVEPTMPDETNISEFGTVFVTLSFSGAPAWLLGSIIQAPDSLSYIPLEKRQGLSPQEEGFSPDFFNIRRRARYVMESTPVSIVQWDLTSEALRNIPITIHPEVVREAEERILAVDLETSIGLAQEAYPTLSTIEVNVEHDPEIFDRRTIRFTFGVSGDPKDILRNEVLFKENLCSRIDDRVRELITVTYSWDG